MAGHLSLADKAILVFVNKFDWILNSNNVRLLLTVNCVNQRCQRGALAGAGGTGYRNQALGSIDQTRKLFRKIQLADGLDCLRNQTKGRRDAMSMHKNINAEAANSSQRITQIQIPVFDEYLPLFLGENFKNQTLATLGGHSAIALLHHLTIDSHERRRARGQVQVRSTLLFHLPEKIVESRHILVLNLRWWN